MHWLKLGLRIVPIVVATIQAVEALLVGSKRGDDKKAFVLNFVDALLNAGEGIAGKDLLKNEQVRLAISELIDAIVKAENAIAAARAALVTSP